MIAPRALFVLLLAVVAIAALPAYGLSAGPLGNRSVPGALENRSAGPQAFSFTASRLARVQRETADLPTGERIAAVADSFVGTPYDTDPLGAYVSSEKIACDSEIDCMYMVFRSVEVATSDSLEGAEARALELRFRTKGVVKDGRVVNYDERFEYGQDMIASSKWGENVTAGLGASKTVPGSRGHRPVIYMPAGEMSKQDALGRLRDGDIIFFVKDPAKRVVGEIIGHLGIIKVEDGVPMLVHASGTKAGPERPGGGLTKKVELAGYLADTKFIGVQVTRFR